MADTQKKPIDKEYLISSFKDFDSKVLNRKYLKSDDEQLQQLHSHENEDILDKLNVSNEGKLLYNGREINKNEIAQLSDDIEEETARAKQAEETNANEITRLSEDIETEITRAKDAEQANANQISAEQDRAYNRENTIADKIDTVSQEIHQLIDLSYANANGYTDDKIAKLINGAPTTLDTLKEIADVLEDNADVVGALNDAIGTKAPQAELDTHISNSTIHVTASDKENWTTPTFTQASSRTNIDSRESLPILLGKIKKYFADLKNVSFSGDYNDLINKPEIPTGNDKEPTILSATLTAGATSISFTDSAITDDSLIDVYTDPYCTGLSAIEQNESTLTLTFDKQTQDIKVLVKVGVM